jgi:hypothetical protein
VKQEIEFDIIVIDIMINYDRVVHFVPSKV